MASMSMAYEAPQASVLSELVAATGKDVEHPPVTVAAEQFAEAKMSVVEEGQSMPSQSVTYEAPQALVASETIEVTDIVVVQPVATVAPEGLATGKVVEVVVHPPVTVTAEEFAKLNGSVVTETETVGMETAGVGTKREVDVNGTEAVDETVKIKKKKSKRCC